MGKTKPVINRAMSSIKAAMRRAEQWELVTEQAWSNVRRLKTPTSKKLIYSMESFKEFILPECHGVWRKVAMLGQFGALRRAEMYWLAVNDLDFSKDIIHICGKDGWIPKDGEDRDIPMFPDLKRFLQSVPMGQRWVLGDDRPSLEVMSSYFKKIVRRAGCKGGIHTLRHSCATWLGDNGWSDRQIADFLGHSKTDMTAGYIHGNVKALVEASRKIPQVLLQGHTPVVAVLKGSERPR
jgi:integrase